MLPHQLLQQRNNRVFRATLIIEHIRCQVATMMWKLCKSAMKGYNVVGILIGIFDTGNCESVLKFQKMAMKPQEVLSIVTQVSSEDLKGKSVVVQTYPELDQYFEKGMYVEQITQTNLEDGKCIITFVFRYYNRSTSKTD